MPRLALFVVVTVAGSALLNAVVKLAVDRARPVVADPVAHASGMSFPSGHAQSAVVATSVLRLVFLPLLRGARRSVAVVLAVAFMLAIGFARVALGVHFVSDVLAGYALGAAWVAAMIAAFNAGGGSAAGRHARRGGIRAAPPGPLRPPFCRSVRRR